MNFFKNFVRNKKYKIKRNHSVNYLRFNKAYKAIIPGYMSKGDIQRVK